MEIQSASALIAGGVVTDRTQTWADLGAGSGLFTKALLQLLPRGSKVIAIDRSGSKIDGEGIISRKGNFLELDFDDTDGIVMANSLHYVEDQVAFIQMLSEKTKRLIVVEYDTDKRNQWVPYPVSFNKLKSLFPGVKRIGKQASQYHSEGMYSALLIF